LPQRRRLGSKRGRDALAVAIGFSKSKVADDQPFLLADGESVAVLLDPVALEDFIEQGEELADFIETVYLPFPTGKAFNEAKDQVTEAWRPLIRTVEIKTRHEGWLRGEPGLFSAGLSRSVPRETGGELEDILPSLWMMAGCRGKLPTCRGN